MRFETTIKRWGNSLALRITSDMASEPALAENIDVIVETTPDKLIISRVHPVSEFSMPFSEDELIDSIQPGNDYSDLLASTTVKELGIE